jgi:hypothetical protein
MAKTYTSLASTGTPQYGGITRHWWAVVLEAESPVLGRLTRRWFFPNRRQAKLAVGKLLERMEGRGEVREVEGGMWFLLQEESGKRIVKNVKLQTYKVIAR